MAFRNIKSTKQDEIVEILLKENHNFFINKKLFVLDMITITAYTVYIVYAQ